MSPRAGETLAAILFMHVFQTSHSLYSDPPPQTHRNPLSLPLSSLAPVNNDVRQPVAATSPTTATSTTPSSIQRLTQGPPATATTTIAAAAHDALAVCFVQKHGRPARFPTPTACPAASAVAPPSMIGNCMVQDMAHHLLMLPIFFPGMAKEHGFQDFLGCSHISYTSLDKDGLKYK